MTYLIIYLIGVFLGVGFAFSSDDFCIDDITTVVCMSFFWPIILPFILLSWLFTEFWILIRYIYNKYGKE